MNEEVLNEVLVGAALAGSAAGVLFHAVCHWSFLEYSLVNC